MAIFNFYKRNTRLSLLLFVFTTLISNSHAANLSALGNESLKQTSIEIVNQLRLHHYRYISIDNDFSAKLLDKYLARLDSTKSYLLQSDIEQFEIYRYGLDNALNKGDLEPALAIFNQYQQRVADRLNWLIIQLETNNPKIFDFSTQDDIEVDRKNASWANTKVELDELWFKRLKHAALNLKLAKKEPNEIGELLIKRYRNQFRGCFSAIHECRYSKLRPSYRIFCAQTFRELQY